MLDPELLAFLDQLALKIGEMSEPSQEAASQLDKLDIGKVAELGKAFQQTQSLATIALNQVHQLVGQIQSQFAGFVSLFDPSAMTRFDIAVRDLNASIGEALLPVFDRATAVIRALADSIAGMSPGAKTMIAALAAAAVSMGVMTVAAQAFSAVIATVTGGLSLVVGVIAGLIASVASVSGTFAGLEQALKPLANGLSTVLTLVGEAFAKVVGQAQPFLEVLGGSLGQALESLVPVVDQMVTQLGMNAAELMPLFESLLPPIGQLVGVVAQLVGGLSALQGAVLRPLLGILSPVVELIGSAVDGLSLFVSGFSAIVQVLAGIVSPILEVIALPFRVLAEVIGEVRSAVGPAMSEVQAALAEFGQVFSEAGAIIGELVKEAVPLIVDFIQPVVAMLLDMAKDVASVLTDLARYIREFTDEIRDLFGIERITNRNVDKASEGKAIRDVSQGGIEDIIKRAQQAAFSIGKAADPAVNTEKNTRASASALSLIATELNNFRKDFQSFTGPVLNALNIAGQTVQQPLSNPQVRNVAIEAAKSGFNMTNFLTRQVFGD